MVIWDQMEPQETMELKAQQVTPELMVMMVQLVTREHREIKDKLVHKDQLVIKDLKEAKDPAELRETKDHQETMDKMDTLEKRDQKEIKV